MTSLLLAMCGAVGTYLLLTRRTRPSERRVEWISSVRSSPRRVMRQVGLGDISPSQFAASSLLFGATAAASGAAVFGFGASTLLIAVIAAAAPAISWRNKAIRRRQVARDAWPRMIDELRVLTGAAGRPIPQALLDVGLRGPQELRPAFVAAQREWALTTDFARTIAVLKERTADSTADVVFETLLVAVEVGGDLESRLASLAEDRRQDEVERKDAAAKQAGARFARLFVIIVPGGMALAGLNVGDGAAAYRTLSGQVLVSVGVGVVAVCWIWASRIMRLPEASRVFDR